MEKNKKEFIKKLKDGIDTTFSLLRKIRNII
jgi:hypothetical protein